MRQITKNICRYNELSDKAKETARQNDASSQGFIGEDEAFASLKKLAEHFGGNLDRYEVDFFDSMYSSARFDMSGTEDEAIGKLLEKLGSFNPETNKGLGDCVLTGVCYDEDAIDGFRIAYHGGERDIYKLMEAAFRSWLKSCQSECRSFYDDEDDCFAEHAKANNLEFYEDGKSF